jgi:hypothetical protein
MTVDSTHPDRSHAILLDGFGRIAEGVPAVIDGLSVDELLWQPDPAANSVAWLVWHLTRQQDEQIAHLAGTPSVYRDGWEHAFGLPYASGAHGYGMTPTDVQAFRLTDPSLLTGYYAATHDATIRYLADLEPVDQDRVIDRHWTPPVTVAVRIVSVLDDAAKHLGQAEYVRGLVRRRRNS